MFNLLIIMRNDAYGRSSYGEKNTSAPDLIMAVSLSQEPHPSSQHVSSMGKAHLSFLQQHLLIISMADKHQQNLCWYKGADLLPVLASDLKPAGAI